MITDFTDATAPACFCDDAEDLDILRTLIAAGHDQRDASQLLWGDLRRASPEVRGTYQRLVVQHAYAQALPWLQDYLNHEGAAA